MDITGEGSGGGGGSSSRYQNGAGRYPSPGRLNSLVSDQRSLFQRSIMSGRD